MYYFSGKHRFVWVCLPHSLDKDSKFGWCEPISQNPLEDHNIIKPLEAVLTLSSWIPYGTWIASFLNVQHKINYNMSQAVNLYFYSTQGSPTTSCGGEKGFSSLVVAKCESNGYCFLNSKISFISCSLIVQGGPLLIWHDFPHPTPPFISILPSEATTSSVLAYCNQNSQFIKKCHIEQQVGCCFFLLKQHVYCLCNGWLPKIFKRLMQ